jgi:hypothetical protein
MLSFSNEIRQGLELVEAYLYETELNTLGTFGSDENLSLDLRTFSADCGEQR